MKRDCLSSAQSLTEFIENEAPLLHALPLVEVEVRIGERMITLVCAKGEDAILEQSALFVEFPFGCLLWESAVGLARELERQKETWAGTRVLELGAGIGLAGLVARANGATVTQTDHLPEGLALCRFNARKNGLESPAQFLADWRDWRSALHYDLILGADILYERKMHPALQSVFKAALSPGGTLLLADPCRPQALECLAEMERDGWNFTLKTAVVTLPETPPVEIMLYEGTRKG